MAITFYTSDPAGLLSAFKKSIREGHIVTWSCDSDGDFTHTPDQWRALAWMRPTILPGKLVFTILKRADRSITRAVYAVYHGRFQESMLAHCDRLFESSSTTALATVGDRIAA